VIFWASFTAVNWGFHDGEDQKGKIYLLIKQKKKQKHCAHMRNLNPSPATVHFTASS